MTHKYDYSIFFILVPHFIFTLSTTCTEKGWAKIIKSSAFILEIKSTIGPGVSDFVRLGLEKANEEKASLFILQLDTPGGLDLAMRKIVKVNSQNGLHLSVTPLQEVEEYDHRTYCFPHWTSCGPDSPFI